MYLNSSGLAKLVGNIKAYIASKLPTKTSELTNDSGFLTSHQSLSNYVTTNTEQTITHGKVFKGYVRLIQSDLGSLGTAPTTNKYQAVNFYETTNTQRHAMLEYCYRTTGQNDIKIAIYNPQKTTDFASLIVGYDLNGVAFTKAVTPPNTSNSTDIATTKWVVDKGYVDLASSQTITGIKKLISGGGIYHSSLVKGTLPTSTQYINIALTGSNGYTGTVNRMGVLETAVNTSGDVSTYITAYQFKSGVNTNRAIGVCYPLSGTPYAFAPNPDDGTANQKIATTNWVESKGYLTSHQDLSNYVTLNTAQNISAVKTIYNTDPRIEFKDSGLDFSAGALTANNNNNTIITRDKNGLAYGVIQHRAMSGDRTRMSFYTYQINRAADGKVTTSAKETLYLQTEKDGSSYAYVLNTPPSTDNSTKIATTAWVSTTLSSYETKANAITDLSISGKTITYTKGDGETGTITTQDTNTTYANMSQAELNTGTATAARSISAKVLSTWVNAKKYISQSNLEIMGIGTVAMLYCKSTVLTKSTGYYSLPFATSVAGANLYCVYFRTSSGSDTNLENSSNSGTEVGYQFMNTNGTVSGTWKYIGNTIRISALQPICGLFVRIA